MLGAGMVLIQEHTHKIVVVYETQKKYWFFPRGRKDIGESLEQTALREAYEEVIFFFFSIFNQLGIPNDRHWAFSRVIAPSSCHSLALIMPLHHHTTGTPTNARVLNRFLFL